MSIGFASLLCSTILTWITLFTNKFHANFTNDTDLNGIQKYHLIPTPRIGGIPIFITFIVISYIFGKLQLINNNYCFDLVLSSMLVFIIGTLEDITKRVDHYMRLLLITCGVLVAIYITHALPIIHHSGLLWLNALIDKFPVIGLLLSIFCTVGLTNAFNVIDGYHGLSAITSVLNLLGLALLAIFVHDHEVLIVSISISGALLGFIFFNYPWGKIFLGDGGAYTIGFIIALLSIYLIEQHAGSISPFAVLLMSVYPVTEIGFSVYRRKVIHKTDGMKPDNMHLHQLVYHRCVPITKNNQNAHVMPKMLLFIIPPMIIASFCYESTALCVIAILGYVIFYVTNYFKIIRFKTFKFLKF